MAGLKMTAKKSTGGAAKRQTLEKQTQSKSPEATSDVEMEEPAPAGAKVLSMGDGDDVSGYRLEQFPLLSVLLVVSSLPRWRRADDRLR
jgi:hypothetical protein